MSEKKADVRPIWGGMGREERGGGTRRKIGRGRKGGKSRKEGENERERRGERRRREWVVEVRTVMMRGSGG